MTSDVKTMQTKKTTSTKTAESSAKSKNAQSFIGDVKSEFNKITWTSREELISYTKVVIATTFLFGMGIYFIDLVIQGCLNGLAVFARLLGG